MKRNSNSNFAYLLIIGIIAIALRFLPHPANFAAMGGLCLAAGRYGDKSDRWWLPLLFILISDLVLGVYGLKMMLAVYFSYWIMIVSGQTSRNLALNKLRNFIGVGATAVLGSVSFYLITNAAVWAFSSLYPARLSGLLASYTAALPFFRNSLMSDLITFTAFVGVYEFGLLGAYKFRTHLQSDPKKSY